MPWAAALAAEIAARCAGATPVEDPALSALMRGKDGGDTAAVARAVLRSTWDPWPEVLIADGPGARERLAEKAPCGASHYGFAEDRRRASAVFVRRLARLKHGVREGSLILDGDVDEGYFAPRLYVTTPAGRPRHLALAPIGARGFRGEVRLDAPGRWLVEVMADGPAGPVVASLGELFSGVEPPRAPPAAPPEPDPADPEAEVAARINALRGASGLARLARDETLDAAARGHADDMAREGRAAHVLSGNRTVAARLEAADYPFAVERENVGEADTALAAHAAVFKSPAHHLNLLTDDVDRIGVGLARRDGRVYLAEVLARKRSIPGNSDEIVFTEMQAERRRRGLAPLVRRKEMDAFALQAVRDAVDHDAHPEGLAERAVAALPGLRAITVQSFVTTSPETAAARVRAEPQFSAAGVGAVVASTPKRGRDKLWLIVLLGEK
jgi:hypothetical protein